MNKKIKSTVIMILIISFIVSNVTGCIEKKDTANLIKRDYLVYNIEEFPKDLTMLNNENIREKDLLFALFEGLVREEENSIEPALAEDWIISDDRIQYDFKIRDDAAWSTGEKITAKDFEEFFKYLLKEGKNNYFIKELSCIYGVDSYIKNKCNFDEVGIKASKDNKTLTIRLNTPCPYLLSILSNPLLTLRDKNHFTDDYINGYSNLRCSGPFKICELEENKFIDLNKNSYYWEKDKVISNNIKFVAIKESEEALLGFESYIYNNNKIESSKISFLDKLRGNKAKKEVNKDIDYKKFLSDIDIIINPPRNEVERLSQENFIDTYGSLRTLDLVFNVGEGNICRDINFRNAIKSALSSDIIKDLVDEENTEVSSSVIPGITSNEKGGEIGDRKSFKLNPDIEKAKGYIKDVNFKENKKDEISIVCPKNTLCKLICKNIKEELEKKLEIKLNIIDYENNEFKDKLEQGQYDMALVEFQGSYDNPICFLNNWKENGYASFTSYKNSEFELLTNRAIYEKNIDKKYENIYKAEEILFKDSPVIPMINFNTVVCKREYVKDIIVTKCGNIRFNKAYKEEK